jgi:hypothetical protein
MTGNCSVGLLASSDLQDVKYIGASVRTETSVPAMYKGFMDESGLHPHDIACSVAGFVGSGSVCDRAIERWNEVVRPIGTFHAEEFFRRREGKMKGIYEGIRSDDADQCAYGLIDLLKESGLEPLGMAIHAETFRDLSEDERRWMTSAALYGKDWPMQGSPNNPYFSCFHFCITNSSQFAPDGEAIHLTFDRQETYAGNAKKIYSELRNLGGRWGERLDESLTFSSKTDSVLLQAADLLAYSIGQKLNQQPLNPVVNYALVNLAYEKEYIRAMDAKAIDFHLRKCPFRITFWKGLTEPDLIEQLAGQGVVILTYKADEKLYLTHHLKPEKVRIVASIAPQVRDGR